MKKKLFLSFLVLTMLVCIFAFSVNAEEISTPSYDRTYTIDGVDYRLWEQDSEGNYHPLIWYLNSENEMCSVWADGKKNTRGAFVNISNSGTQLSKMTVNDDGKNYTSDSSFVIVNLNGVELTYEKVQYPVKYIRFSVFHKDSATNGNTSYYYSENSVLKAVFLPQTISQIGYHDGKVVQGASTLFYSFSNCTALEYVEFHSNTVLNDNTLNKGGFTNCSSLKAISLPDSITIFGSDALGGCTSLQAVYLPSSLTSLSSSSDPFAKSSNIYFVNEPFTMNSASDVPSKPEVYCLPQGLTSFGKAIFPSNVNKIVVISEKVTSHSTKIFAGSGIETVVYLGNMTSFGLTSAQSTPLNVLMPNTTVVPTVSASGETNGLAVYLCKLNKSYVFGENAWKDVTVHIEDPRKTVITKAPNCEDNAMKDTTCFCGVHIGEVEIENTNNGGKHDLDISTLVISYTDFTKAGCKTQRCTKCNIDVVIEEAPALFTCLGYSAPEDGRGGIAIGFTVNNVAIAEYEEATGKTVSYGIFAALKDRLNGSDVFENGEANECAIVVDMTTYATAAFEIKIVGFETDAQKDAKIAMGAYVAVTDGETTEYSYMQGGEPNENEKYCFVSFNDIIGKQPANAEVTQ